MRPNISKGMYVYARYILQSVKILLTLMYHHTIQARYGLFVPIPINNINECRDDSLVIRLFCHPPTIQLSAVLVTCRHNCLCCFLHIFISYIMISFQRNQSLWQEKKQLGRVQEDYFRWTVGLDFCKELEIQKLKERGGMRVTTKR